jgi:integrase
VGARGARRQLLHAANRTSVRRRFVPHQLRHAHVVEMSREGVPLLVIQRQLGHADDRDYPRPLDLDPTHPEAVGQAANDPPPPAPFVFRVTEYARATSGISPMR